MTQGLTGRRRRLALLLAAVLATSAATAATASAATSTFSNATLIAIPDTGPATPYPSSVNASGFAGNVQKATVTLRNLTHTCPEDIQALLVGPSGAKSILMANVGGCPQTDIGLINLTFDQAVTNTIQTSTVPASGTYRPSDSGTTSSLSPPAPANPYQANLGVFNGTAANGTWNLFVEDCCAADQGSIGGGWSLTLNAPVNTVTAGKPKLNKKKGTAQVPVTVGDAGRLTLSGKGVKGKSVTVAGPGSANLSVKPKGKTSRKLSSSGKATAKVKITFTPTGGTANTVTKKLKLKKN
jgi:subtilisin-like proprotein convertase family protein